MGAACKIKVENGVSVAYNDKGSVSELYSEALSQGYSNTEAINLFALSETQEYKNLNKGRKSNVNSVLNFVQELTDKESTLTEEELFEVQSTMGNTKYNDLVEFNSALKEVVKYKEADSELRNLDRGTVETTNPIKLYKGKGGKWTPKGERVNVHSGVQGSFTTLDTKTATTYEGGKGYDIYQLPIGTKVEVVDLRRESLPLSQIRSAETEAINKSKAQVVKLITNDIGGRSEQYVVKDPELKPESTKELPKPTERNLHSFEIDNEKAIKSGIFSREELKGIDAERLYETQIALEGTVKTTNIPSVKREKPMFKDTTARTSLGTFRTIEWDEIVDQVLRTPGKSLEDKLHQTPFAEISENKSLMKDLKAAYDNLTLIPNVKVTSEGLERAESRRTEILRNTLPFESDTTNLVALKRLLTGISNRVWDLQPEKSKAVIKSVEKELSNFSIDFIGANQTDITREETLSVLNQSIRTLREPSTQNIEILGLQLDTILKPLPRDNYRSLPDKYKGLSVFEINTSISENELWNNHGLIRLQNNLYHKINPKSQEQVTQAAYNLYKDSEVFLPKEIFTTEDPKNQENELQTKADMERYFANSYSGNKIKNNVQLYSSYQFLFNHSPADTLDTGLLSTIVTDTEYLTEDFVQDFYYYQLQEKIQNSPIYKNILSKFSVTNSDIDLIAPLSSAEGIRYKQELEDYIKLKNHSNMKHLLPQLNLPSNQDLEVINKELRPAEAMEVSLVQNNEIITSLDNGLYTSYKGEVYRKTLESEGNYMYEIARLNQDNVYASLNANFKNNSTLPENSQLMKEYSISSRIQNRRTQIANTSLQKLSKLSDKDISVTHADQNSSIIAFKEGEEIGRLNYSEQDSGVVVDSYKVIESERGKGLGTEMYLQLVDKGYKVFKNEDLTTLPSVFDMIAKEVGKNEDGSLSVDNVKNDFENTTSIFENQIKLLNLYSASEQTEIKDKTESCG